MRRSRIRCSALFGILFSPLPKQDEREDNRAGQQAPVGNVNKWNGDHPVLVGLRIDEMGKRDKNEGDNRDRRMMPVDAAPLVSDADNHTTPVHGDDVHRKEQNDYRQDDARGIHATSPNVAAQWRAAKDASNANRLPSARPLEQRC